MTSLSRYGAIWLAQIRYSTVREMMFKTNFVLWILVELTWLALHLSFIQFLYLQVDSVAGWSKWQMVLLVAINNLIQQVFQTFLMVNCTKLPELIRTGRLDFFLAQPAATQFLISTRYFEPGSVVNVFVGAMICVVALTQTGLIHTWPGILFLPLFLMSGVLLHYAILLTLMSLAFWMTRAQGIVNAYYSILQMARLPREAFHGAARLIFTWGLPLLLIANVPARTLLGELHWWQGPALLGLTFFFLGGSTLVFQAGLRRYGSASS